MAFDSAYYVTRVEIPGFRDEATGALSSDWTLATNTQSTRDLAVRLDNVNICWEATTAVVAGTAWWKTKFVDFRVYASLRGSSVVGGHANIFASPINAVGAPSGGGLAYWLDVAVGTTSNIGTQHGVGGGATYFSATVTANLWYRVMLEKIGPRIRFWFNATGNADPRSLTDSGLSLLRDVVVVDGVGGFGVQVGMHASPAAGSASNYSGICDLTLQTLTKQAVTAPSPGGSLATPDLTPYVRYKTIRQAQNTYNNLVLGP